MKLAKIWITLKHTLCIHKQRVLYCSGYPFVECKRCHKVLKETL